MSKRQLKTDDEEGFLRAFRDEVMDLVAEYNVRVEFHLVVPVLTKGLAIRGWAWRKDAEGVERLAGACEQAYPSHTVNRFHAALYRAAVWLGVSIRDKLRENGSGEEQAL